MKKILVVDDEKPISDIVKFNLTKEGYDVYTAYDGEEALQQVKEVEPDLILLDLMLPKIDGLEVAREVRKTHDMPIIMVTAKDSEIDKVLGLELGADDYVTKPFEPLELMARVKAQLRRYQKYNNVKEENVIDFRGIVINNDTHEFIFNNEKIELTKTEFAILWILCENRGNVVKSDTLFSTVWKENYFEKDNNTIMVHIRHIREKMKDTYSKPKYIKTIYGVGYKIEK